MPTLVIKDEKSKMTLAEIVPSKGLDKYAGERAVRMIEYMGYGEMILKSDQEASIMALTRFIKERLNEKIMLELWGSIKQMNRWKMAYVESKE